MPNDEDSGRLPLTGDDIINAVRAAGWLLEQETASAVTTAGFHTSIGYAFPDLDDPTNSRDIDVFGFKQLVRDEEQRGSINLRLIAECKHSSMPYVLIGSRQNGSLLRRLRTHEVIVPVPKVETGRTPLDKTSYRLHQVEGVEYLGLTALPENPWMPRFVANQMTRLERKKTWVADNTGIFASLTHPLAKAVTHFRRNAVSSSTWSELEFLVPLLVTSAPIYELNVDSDILEPHEVPWSTMARTIRSKSVDGTFYVDVVNSAHLSVFLRSRIGVFSDAVTALLASNVRRLSVHEDHSWSPNA